MFSFFIYFIIVRGVQRLSGEFSSEVRTRGKMPTREHVNPGHGMAKLGDPKWQCYGTMLQVLYSFYSIQFVSFLFFQFFFFSGPSHGGGTPFRYTQ